MAITVARTREELYEDVWSQPMLTLARRYGMSDRGLAKLCSRHRIPVPGRDPQPANLSPGPGQCQFTP